MAQQLVNTGTSANDGTGDSLRIAAEKINQNFSEVYSLVTSTSQQPADWSAQVGVTQILNKPAIFSGSYADLTSKPTLSTVALTGQYADLIGKPNVAAVSSSGSYNDLINKPTLFSGSYADLTNKPTLFSGSYADLTNKPTIPNNTNQLINGSNFITLSSVTWSNLTNKPNVSTWVDVPEHSYGKAGDIQGTIACDGSYFYICIANYVNNLTTIWQRVSLSGITW
jgi:hypothetical protein